MRRILGLILILILGVLPYCSAEQVGQADKRWRAPVSTSADLPTVGNQPGDVRWTMTENQFYGWSGIAWVPIAGTGIGDKFKVSVADTTAGFLDTKLTVGDAISKAITSGGGDEREHLDVLFDDSSIGVNGSNQLYVKDTGIVATMLNADIAGDGLVLDGGTNALAVNVDDTTIEINSDTLRVKDNAIDVNKLQDDAVTVPKIFATNTPSTNDFLRWTGSALEWTNPSTVVEVHIIYKTITQTLHGFSAGDVLRYDAGTSKYIKAQADSAAHAEVAGIVYSSVDADHFNLVMQGYLGNLSGLTAGEVYYLSATTPGALTATAPTTVGQISKPLLIAVDIDKGYFVNWRGIELGEATAPADAPFVTVGNTGDLTAERAITAGTAITVTDNGANSTVTIGVTAGSIGDTQLAYHTGQHLTTLSNPTFAGLTLNGNITIGTDDFYNIGDETHRVQNIYTHNIYTGDLRFENDWVIVEDWENEGLLLKAPNGKTYKFVLQEVR